MDLKSSIATILELLQEATGFEALMLTEIKGRVDDPQQTVVHAHSTKESSYQINAGDHWSWKDSGCSRLRNSHRYFSSDMQKDFPDLEVLKTMGVQGYISVPIEIGPDERLYGTICAMSESSKEEQEEIVGLLRIVAKAIANRIQRDLDLEIREKLAKSAREQLSLQAHRFAQEEHRVKTGIGVIASWLELMNEPDTSEIARGEALAISIRRAHQLREEIAGMIRMAKSQALAPELIGAIPLSEAIHEALDSLPITVERRIEEGIWVHAFEEYIISILEHLIDNARRYGGSEIAVILERIDGEVVLKVEDSGITDSSTKEKSSGGTDMGLNTVRTMAESMSAQMFAEFSAMGSVVGIKLTEAEEPLIL